MTLSEFLQRFLYHVTAALAVLAIVLLIAERLVPGSVLPFVDVIDLLPIVFGLVMLTILSQKKKSQEAP